jgi:aldose 1-epimerase
MKPTYKAYVVVLAAALAVAFFTGCATHNSSSLITPAPFGKTLDGKPVEIYTLRNANGMTARIMTYGGIVQSLLVPDKNGQLGDVVLGYDTLERFNKNYSRRR